MPRSRSEKVSKTRRPPRPERRTLDRAALIDAAENIGEEFAEAAEHVARRPFFGGWRLGPSTDLPLADLIPGALGWGRALYRREATGDGVPGAAEAEVACVVIPSTLAAGPPFTPFRELRTGETIVTRDCPGWPRRLLVARFHDRADRGLAIDFLEAVAGEMRQDEGVSEP